jgi:hypothetical protein
MTSRVYILVPQLADDPPLNPLRKSFVTHSDAIQDAKALLIAIGDRAGCRGGSISVGEQPGHDDVNWLGTWRWNTIGLWSWEAE